LRPTVGASGPVVPRNAATKVAAGDMLVAADGAYRRLEAEQRKPKPLVDHAAKLERLPTVADTNGAVEKRIISFCETKHISRDALVALDTRVKVDSHGGVELAWGYPAKINGTEIVSALKYRSLDPGKDRYAEAPSTFVQPLVIGKRDALDWFIAEGETDTARLYDLVGDVAAILCLPAGARTFKREWADVIPRGATVHLAHDNDEDGDAGAATAAALLGGRTVRVTPPDGYVDWCDWDGDRMQFLELVGEARAAKRSSEFVTLDQFLKHPYPKAEPLLGDTDNILLAIGSLLLVFGADGSAKSTWSVDALAHLAAGQDWLGIHVPRPVRFCLIENEGPPSLFQKKIEDKAATWDGAAWKHNVFVYQSPWGEFSFADADQRRNLVEYCDEHAIDVVSANPTLGLGVAGTGSPDETQTFVNWLVECGLKSTLAFWLLHHENKSGQISGDWGRHPDTKVQLQADGSRPRTKLTWQKTRWAVLTADTTPKKQVFLDWVIDTRSYTVSDINTTATSNVELEESLDEYLTDNPLAPTKAVLEHVQGTDKRIRELLKTSPKYDSVPGARGAVLWFHTPESPESGTA
jgi:hypothetical protein